ncbi:hypothetical protein [Spiroplasma taiwanense]|uniref:Plectrovirus svts2 orf 1 transmembrane protein n=1 Tax=Spiroplasma taiwanense CT-1 TaxID=1276220 RepID=S5LX51_9MOLU|nr:hypothetical protein [Spiroplasma taiwanense]AGR41206.1 plectrovirus svts2 orf 1 transmembrane protein [Spiroplasma taiwanense CT-1]
MFSDYLRSIAKEEMANYYESFFVDLTKYFFELNPLTSVEFIVPNYKDKNGVWKKINLNYNMFIKNGFNLYPKTLLISRLDYNGGNAPYPPNINLNYKNISNINYDTNLNYYSYLNSKDIIGQYIKVGSTNYLNEIKAYTIDKNVQGFNSVTAKIESTVLNTGNANNIESKKSNFYGFNFVIYNSDDWNNVVNSPDQFFNIPYQKCGITNIMGCIANGFIWAVNTLIDFTGFSKFVSPIVTAGVATTDLLKSIQNLFAFNVTFSIMIYSIMTLAIIIAIGKIF